MPNPINRGYTTPQAQSQFTNILNKPEAQNIINSIQRQMPNASPRDIAMQLAKQKGIDINPILKSFGLR